LSGKTGDVKYRNEYKDIEAITKSHLIGSHNFIIHFKNRESLELASEHKELLIETIF